MPRVKRRALGAGCRSLAHKYKSHQHALRTAVPKKEEVFGSGCRSLGRKYCAERVYAMFSGGPPTSGKPGIYTDTKSWSLASRNAAIPPWRSTSSSVLPRVAVDSQPWGLSNGHLFLSSATKIICPNFSHQTTTFLEKGTDLSLPKRR